MKKIALLLCMVLTVSTLLYGCGKDKPTPETSSAANSTSSVISETTSMPTTPAEIVKHNDKIDPASIDLVQFKTPANSKTATVKTSMGDFKIVLYPDEAPKAVEAFLALAKDGAYNGLPVSQIIPTVRVAVGGDTALGETFADEYSLNLWHFNGAVAMNNGGEKDKNDGRFFIVTNTQEISDELLAEMVDGGFPEKVVNKYLDAGGVPNYDFKDTVFGQVTEGMDIVQKIASAERDADNKPKTEITITSVEVSEA